MFIRKKNIGIVAFLFSFLILFFIIYFGLGFKVYTPAYKTEWNTDTQCVRRNLTEFLRFKQEYKKITEYILHIPDFNGILFSYPHDSIFYSLFTQQSPYYSNTYDASSLYAQQKQIQFIEKNNIHHIVINTHIL